MPAVKNISAYRFAALDDLELLRASLCSQCRDWGLKGTIILSIEGINLSVAGGATEIDQLLRFLRHTGAGRTDAEGQ